MPINRVRVLLILFFASAACGAADPAAGQPPPGQPNILLIMADDIGYSDIGPYGSEIRTPNLDRLADGGLRFTQFYNMAKCETTRAALHTGLFFAKRDAGNARSLGGLLRDAGSLLPVFRGETRPAPEILVSGFTERFRMVRIGDGSSCASMHRGGSCTTSPRIPPSSTTAPTDAATLDALVAAYDAWIREHAAVVPRFDEVP